MADNMSNYIEKMYNTHMWFSDYHRLVLYKMKEEQSLSDSDIQSLVQQYEGSVKDLFSRVFNRMGNKEKYYTIPTRVFPVGNVSDIVVSCKYKCQKLVGHYKVVISSFYNYEYKVSEPYSPYVAVIEAKDNKLVIPYQFENEDMHSITVFFLQDGEEMLLLSSNIYAVNQDLYECNYYKADFHIHTNHSDGYEPPELVVASARECGMDIIAITDHNAFSGSVAARGKAMEMSLDMTVILGEEYSLEYSPMHILSLGTEKEIDRKYLTMQVRNMPDTQKIIESKRDLSCDVEAYACTQVLLDQIEKEGGTSILAHPYWKPYFLNGTRMDTPESLFIELSKDQRFAGIEIVSGSPEKDFNVSNLQNSLAQTMLERFKGIPIIGITDSHAYTTDSIAGKHFTIVFAKTKSEEHVIDALRNGFTVAAELVNGTPLCYGSHRLVKLAEFLIKYYFPERDKKARSEALAVKEKYLLNHSI